MDGIAIRETVVRSAVIVSVIVSGTANEIGSSVIVIARGIAIVIVIGTVIAVGAAVAAAAAEVVAVVVGTEREAMAMGGLLRTIGTRAGGRNPATQ